MKPKQTKLTARYAAIETLLLLARDRQPVKPVLENLCSQYCLSVKDRSLAKNLVYGILRNRPYLDSLLGILCRQPLNRIKPKVYHGLCVGLYQLFFLDRIPQSAAVNESVQALRAMKVPQKLVGFANGVLRESIRQKDNLPLPKPPETQDDILNHPEWLTRRWTDHYGAEKMVTICKNNGYDPQLTLRIDASRISREEFIERCKEQEIKAEKGSFSPTAVLINEKNILIDQLPGFSDGLFHVQDQSAQLASLLLSPVDSCTGWLDCCAGLGGKTIHMGEMLFGDIPLEPQSEITAIEPEYHRFQKLLANMGSIVWKDKVHCLNMSLEQFCATKPNSFDRILLDAPCSGTGVIGRHPDIRWNRQEEDIRQYAKTQRFLLNLAASLLAPGGVLVYATCSIEPEENFGVIDSLLQDKAFHLSDCRTYLPEAAWPHIDKNCFAPLPSNELDGFFAARIERKAD